MRFNGVNVPANLSRAGLENWAADHADEVICNFNSTIGPSSPSAAVINNLPCFNGPGGGPTSLQQPPGSQGQPQPSQARSAKRPP